MISHWEMPVLGEWVYTQEPTVQQLLHGPKKRRVHLFLPASPLCPVLSRHPARSCSPPAQCTRPYPALRQCYPRCQCRCAATTALQLQCTTASTAPIASGPHHARCLCPHQPWCSLRGATASTMAGEPQVASLPTRQTTQTTGRRTES